MHVRTRDLSLRVQDIQPDTPFVEILSDEGKLAAVVITERGVVTVAQPGDPEFDRYARMTSAKVVVPIQIERADEPDKTIIV